HGALPVCSISGRSCSVIKKFVPSPAQNSGPSLDMLNRHRWTSACAYATGRSATNNSTQTNVGSTSLCRRCSRRWSSVRLRKGITRPCLTPLGIRIAVAVDVAVAAAVAVAVAVAAAVAVDVAVAVAAAVAVAVVAVAVTVTVAVAAAIAVAVAAAVAVDVAVAVAVVAVAVAVELRSPGNVPALVLGEQPEDCRDGHRGGDRPGELCETAQLSRYALPAGSRADDVVRCEDYFAVHRAHALSVIANTAVMSWSIKMSAGALMRLF